jgi:transketolase
LDKWSAFGFHAVEVDGHNIEALETVFAEFPKDPQKPTAIICHTIKGKGIPFAENQAEWHHKSSLKSDQIEALSKCLD